MHESYRGSHSAPLISAHTNSILLINYYYSVTY